VSDNSSPGQLQEPPEAPPAPPSGGFDFLLAATPQAPPGDDLIVDGLTPRTAAAPVLSPAGSRPLGLQRREPRRRSGTGVVDWVALGLSILAPPVGVLASIAALIIGVRRNGYAATVAKVALGVAIVLSLVLGVAYYLVTVSQQKTAAYDAIVQSSSQFCARLKTDPATLASPTYGFPTGAPTISASIAAIRQYDTFWSGLVSVAPAGIRPGTQGISAAAARILSSLQSSRVLDDDGNVAQIQQEVSASGINAWVSHYCK
jgi:hypothetical protein